MIRPRLLLVFLALVALCGCLNRIEREDVFDVSAVPFGKPVASLTDIYGAALRSPPAEKLAGFPHPSYHLAATLYGRYSGTTPYDVYFVADRGNVLRMVILLARSGQAMEEERGEVEGLLTRRYGKPVERPEPLRLPGFTMEQIFWAGVKLNVVEAYAAREAAEGGHGEAAAGNHGGEAPAHAAGAEGQSQAVAGQSAANYGLFIIYEQRLDG